MADKKDDAGNKKKKSIIASLDLKNYKAKYTDIYGNGKSSEVELDDFLIAEPGSDNEKSDNDNSTRQQPNQNPKIRQTVTQKPKILDTEDQKPSIQPIKQQSDIKKSDTLQSNIQLKKEPVAIIQSEDQQSKTQKPIVQNDELDNIDIEKPVKKIERLKDNDFERRVNAEAENDFYDEVGNKNIGATFRSNPLKSKDDNDIDDEGETKKAKGNRKLSLREPVKINIRHEIRDDIDMTIESETETGRPPLRRTETYGIAISAVTFVYSISVADKALAFLSLSLLLYLARPIIAAPFGKHSQTVQNLLKGFSMAMFFGSIFFIFF